MFYATKQNKYINEGVAFELDGIRYPSNWLNCSTIDEKEAIGLVEVQVVGEPKDDRYYWVSTTLEDGVMTYVNTPKELDPLKKAQVSAVNATAYSLLFPSDWMVSKSIETGEPMNADWSAYRASVRAVANQTKDAINAAVDVDELAGIIMEIEWPHDPNYVAPVMEGNE